VPSHPNWFPEGPLRGGRERKEGRGREVKRGEEGRYLGALPGLKTGRSGVTEGHEGRQVWEGLCPYWG